MATPTIERLRAMTDQELIEKHDAIAGQYPETVQYFLDELNRRQQDKQNAIMLGYTRQMLLLTVFVAVLTVANLVEVVLPLLR